MAKRGNGEGSIYFSEKLNRWVGQFTAGRKENAYNSSNYALLKIKESFLGDIPIQKATYPDIQRFLNTITNLYPLLQSLKIILLTQLIML